MGQQGVRFLSFIKWVDSQPPKRSRPELLYLQVTQSTSLLSPGLAMNAEPWGGVVLLRCGRPSLDWLLRPCVCLHQDTWLCDFLSQLFMV